MRGNTSIGAQVAAGLRGAYWAADREPVGMVTTPHVLKTQDNNSLVGYQYARGGETCIVVMAHPREHSGAHYLIPEILDGGYAVWTQPPRAVNNDQRLEHEIALYDLAAALHKVHELGYRKVTVLGNSGGGTLWALYIQQALASPAKRISTTPSGKPTKLAEANLPVPDAVVFVSAHPGQGAVLLKLVDGSLTDENDPFSVDPTLSPFESTNGFRTPPESASYSQRFLERYRAAQEARIHRIDTWALKQVEERSQARKEARSTGSPAAKARAAFSPLFHVWRTDADPRCFDLSLDPSPRKFGSLWGADPFASNFGSVGFARTCTPESWLSTWSSFKSNASMAKCAPAIQQPVLMIDYTGDNMVLPSDANSIYQAIGSPRKTRVSVDGDHHGRALSEGDAPRAKVGTTLRQWLRDQGFAPATSRAAA